MQPTAQAVGKQTGQKALQGRKKISYLFGAESCPHREPSRSTSACANFLLHKSPLICYKQFTESSSVASRSYCLHLSGFVRHLSVQRV